MSTTTAVLLVGGSLGFGFMLAASLWVSFTGSISFRVTVIAFAAFLGLQLVLGVASGSFRTLLLLMLGCMVGIAVSSIVTLPLTAVLYKRFAGKREAAP